MDSNNNNNNCIGLDDSILHDTEFNYDYDTNNNNMTESVWSPNDTELAMVWRAVGCVMESETRLGPRMFSEIVINTAGDPLLT